MRKTTSDGHCGYSPSFLVLKAVVRAVSKGGGEAVTKSGEGIWEKREARDQGGQMSVWIPSLTLFGPTMKVGQAALGKSHPLEVDEVLTVVLQCCPAHHPTKSNLEPPYGRFGTIHTKQVVRHIFQGSSTARCWV